jgi:hypothetical protein
MHLKGTFELKDLPDIMTGAHACDFRIDRWLPIFREDKTLSTALPEKNLEWVVAKPDEVYYGLERWGDILPDEYVEYFSVVILRLWWMDENQALGICANNPSGEGVLIFPA